MEIYVKNIFYFHICLFLAFKPDFIRFVDFTRIAASNIAYSFAHFVVEMIKILAVMAGFNTI